MKKRSSFLTALYEYLERVKPSLVKLFTTEAVKIVLKRMAIVGGIKGWLVSFVIGELIEEADEKLLDPLMVKLGYKAEEKEGAKIYKKMVEAKSPDEWRDIVRDS